MYTGKLIIEPKLPKGEDGHNVFSIRVKNELFERIEAVTSQTGHSRNELINILLEYAVDNLTICINGDVK